MIYKDSKGTELAPGDAVWLQLTPDVRLMFGINHFESNMVVLGQGARYECCQVLGAFKGFKTDVVHFHQLELI